MKVPVSWIVCWFLGLVVLFTLFRPASDEGGFPLLGLLIVPTVLMFPFKLLFTALKSLFSSGRNSDS